MPAGKYTRSPLSSSEKVLGVYCTNDLMGQSEANAGDRGHGKRAIVESERLQRRQHALQKVKLLPCCAPSPMNIRQCLCSPQPPESETSRQRRLPSTAPSRPTHTPLPPTHPPTSHRRQDVHPPCARPPTTTAAMLCYAMKYVAPAFWGRQRGVHSASAWLPPVSITGRAPADSTGQRRGLAFHTLARAHRLARGKCAAGLPRASSAPVSARGPTSAERRATRMRASVGGSPFFSVRFAPIGVEEDGVWPMGFTPDLARDTMRGSVP